MGQPEHQHGAEITRLERQKKQRRRLDEILGKFCHADDVVYSDRGLVEQVLARWKHDQTLHLGDPNE